MTIDQFVKQHEYSIKHSYGKLGKMADYGVWGCRKIIHLERPNPNEFHGCPFVHLEKPELYRLLGTYGIPADQIS
jgi:DNA primase large subunit